MESGSLLKTFHRSTLLVNLLAIAPRYWLGWCFAAIYVVMIVINIDGGPNADDSGHYFMLWFAGICYGAFSQAFKVADLMNKPMLYCMPRQQPTLRKLVLGVGLVVTLAMFAIGVLPEYSYWTPQTTLGTWSLIPIGLMIYLLIVTLGIHNMMRLSIVLTALMFGSALVVNLYFHGSGSDIMRPPGMIFILLGWTSLPVCALCWLALGRKTLRRDLLGTVTVSSDRGDMTTQLENLNLYLRLGSRARDFHTTRLGAYLLRNMDQTSTKQAVLGLIYRLMSSSNPLFIVGLWLVCMALAALLSFKLFDDLRPVIFLNLLVLLVSFQGALMFRSSYFPFLPMGRKAHFREVMINAGLRFALIVTAFVVVYIMSHAAYAVPGLTDWSGACLVIQNLPFTSYLYCLTIAPLLFFLFHRSRKPSWFLFLAFICWFTTYAGPQLAQMFADLHGAVIPVLMLAAWLPFVHLNYQRSYKKDLR